MPRNCNSNESTKSFETDELLVDKIKRKSLKSKKQSTKHKTFRDQR